MQSKIGTSNREIILMFSIELKKQTRTTKVIQAWAIYVLKLLILIIQRLALHQNRVEFRQQFIGAIIISLTALHNIVRCHGTLFRHTETQAAMGQNEL